MKKKGAVVESGSSEDESNEEVPVPPIKRASARARRTRAPVLKLKANGKVSKIQQRKGNLRDKPVKSKDNDNEAELVPAAGKRQRGMMPKPQQSTAKGKAAEKKKDPKTGVERQGASDSLQGQFQSPFSLSSSDLEEEADDSDDDAPIPVQKENVPEEQPGSEDEAEVEPSKEVMPTKPESQKQDEGEERVAEKKTQLRRRQLSSESLPGEFQSHFSSSESEEESEETDDDHDDAPVPENNSLDKQSTSKDGAGFIPSVKRSRDMMAKTQVNAEGKKSQTEENPKAQPQCQPQSSSENQSSLVSESEEEEEAEPPTPAQNDRPSSKKPQGTTASSARQPAKARNQNRNRKPEKVTTKPRRKIIDSQYLARAKAFHTLKKEVLAPVVAELLIATIYDKVVANMQNESDETMSTANGSDPDPGLDQSNSGGAEDERASVHSRSSYEDDWRTTVLDEEESS